MTPTTEELRKRSAELSNRIKLLKRIALQEQIIDLLEGNLRLRGQVKECEQEAIRAKAEAIAAEESLRIDREKRKPISPRGAGV